MEKDLEMQGDPQAVTDATEKIGCLTEEVKASSELNDEAKKVVVHNLKVISEEMTPIQRNTEELNRKIISCRNLLAGVPKLDKALQEIESLLGKADVPIPPRSNIPPPVKMRKRSI